MSRPEASIVALIREEGRMMSGIELAERLGLTVGQTFQALKFLTMAGYLGDGVE